ncbi:UDP-N-acetylglucosamine 2-epimerase [Methanococcoides burtonii]|uniref:UDP-N-acetylglucosamine 2-epimerase n=1 Tax=Methanococcoides burtonii (strain DSM 6242 / NBRC 107633 / OCM 468 / ACE-M) TaxID=259564 RepID=Q12VN5_METBU|nr:UDP-N-acetylglucosamine 2-epimerase [Methanococcoides burtonii]ABE52491.1 UDP-N-acetylglucosamine 2-epimerase [Methanococcoides burtonii DSM 6242]
MKRKIAVVTGTRADYGIYLPVLKAIQRSSKLDLSLIVTGMHLSETFGHTVDEIEKDGFSIDAKIPLGLLEDSGASMALDVGICILGLTDALKKIKPDILLVLGDRGEMLATTIAGIYMNIPVAHLHGGEVSGTVDESIRHAITKLSHIHFPATEESAERIRNLGEDEFRIYVVGAPALDTILSETFVPKEEMGHFFDIDINKPIILVVQHPVTTEVGAVERHIRETMDAVVELGEQTVVIYPNADAGGRKIIETIEQYRNYAFIKIFKNIRHVDYLSLMRTTNVMVGNSSSGIIEAPSFGLPVVNIGTRQTGRQRGQNTIDVDYDKDEIIKAIKVGLYDKDFKRKASKCISPYGNGHAGTAIAEILESI